MYECKYICICMFILHMCVLYACKYMWYIKYICSYVSVCTYECVCIYVCLNWTFFLLDTSIGVSEDGMV